MNSGRSISATPHGVDRERARALVLRHGRDGVAFQGLGRAFSHWFDVERDASVSYVDTGGAWVAAGAPLCAESVVAEVAERFVAAARAEGRRACFFGVERPEALGTGLGAIRLGEQAELDPARWADTLGHHRRLREQLRRARARGVRIRRVSGAELVAGSPLRAAVDGIASQWLGDRHLEPMGFLVAVEPYDLADAHRYYVAEYDGRLVAFTWLVPIPARRGWLVEHTVREPGAPNGTTELLLDEAIRDAAGDTVVSLGLAPLAGPVVWPLRFARAVTSPLYDFETLRAFKSRLHPDRWQPVWLVHSGSPTRSLVDVLRAFAGGSVIGFGVRSLVRHPSGLAWVLAVTLAPWTLLLAALVPFGDGSLFGFSRLARAGWASWDTVLAYLLFRVARRPRRSHLGWLASAALVDALLSVSHFAKVGAGTGIAPGFRFAATIAPVLGTVALAWSASRAPGSAKPV